jgi:hypothetical protein
MRQHFVLATFVAIALSGCTAPAAKQWFSECITVGYDERACQSGARSVNLQVWGNALQGFGSGVRAGLPTPAQASIEPVPASISISPLSFDSPRTGVPSAERQYVQAWTNCVHGSIGPGGCDSIGPGGGKSIGPGGGLSIGPGGGKSIGPGGGQSIGPGGGRSIGPGGGLSIDRDWSRGLHPDTLRPAPFGQNPY